MSVSSVIMNAIPCQAKEPNEKIWMENHQAFLFARAKRWKRNWLSIAICHISLFVLRLRWFVASSSESAKPLAIDNVFTTFNLITCHLPHVISFITKYSTEQSKALNDSNLLSFTFMAHMIWHSSIAQMLWQSSELKIMKRNWHGKLAPRECEQHSYSS